MRSPLFAAGLALVLAGSVQAQDVSGLPGPYPNHIANAILDPARPAEERARDEARRAADVLVLTSVGPGDQVADLVVGSGYFTRLFSVAVESDGLVPGGHVYAWQPGEFVAFQASYGEQLAALDAAYENVTGQTDRFAELDLPDGQLDLAFTAQNYHDFHLAPFPPETAAAVNTEVFAALKPCGRYVVIDHHAQAGSGFTASTSLHRADSAAVQAEIEQAGFRLIATSGILEAPDDPLTANVFDEAIRGRTSQFILIFQKPGDACPA